MKITIQITDPPDEDYEYIASELSNYLIERWPDDDPQVDAWLDYEVGDRPPPTSGQWRSCVAQRETLLDLIRCTRHSGHSGNHVASDGQEVVAVWPQGEGR